MSFYLLFAEFPLETWGTSGFVIVFVFLILWFFLGGNSNETPDDELTDDSS